jgi:hypothetical protein
MNIHQWNGIGLIVFGSIALYIGRKEHQDKKYMPYDDKSYGYFMLTVVSYIASWVELGRGFFK